nr:MAG TPA: hypothetical protein [Caudoviricetes sp.]
MDHSTNAVEMSRHEKRLEYQRKWYAENRERVLAQNRERYKSDPGYRAKRNYSHKKWARNHPEARDAANLRYYVNALRREGYTVIPPEGVEG